MKEKAEIAAQKIENKGNEIEWQEVSEFRQMVYFIIPK